MPTLRRGALSLTPQSWTASPELFAGSPEFAAAAMALQRLGGDLTADDLAQTGVAALLGSDKEFDFQTVGADLARYAPAGMSSASTWWGLTPATFPMARFP